MKNADRPFIGIIIVTMAVLYGVIAPLAYGTVTGYTRVNQWTLTSRQFASWATSSNQTGSAVMAEGSIKKLTDRGFGFINTGGAKDLFFHSKSLQGVTFEALREGQKVSYTEGRGPKGPCAENVTPV